MSKIEVYKTSIKLKRRLDGNSYYAVESVECPSTVYVLSNDEIAVVQSGVTIRIPSNLYEELCSLLEDMKERKV